MPPPSRLLGKIEKDPNEGGVVRMSHHRSVVSTVFLAVVVAMTGALVLLLGSTAQGLSRPRAAVASKRKPVIPVADLVANDAWPGANFGWSVAVSGTTAVVGAPYDNTYMGAAYVFTEVNGTWTNQTELLPSDPRSQDKFGWSVAVSGSTVVIGAPGYGLGAAYVFSDTSGTWTQQAELTEPTGGTGEGATKFGNSVAISGSTVMAGADGDGTGAVFAYTDTAGSWTLADELSAPDGVIGDQFGWSMALSGSTLVVSAVTHASNGAIYVFTDIAGTWTYQAELVASDGRDNDYFGDKVATDGTRIVAGAPGHKEMQGAVYVFDGSGPTWNQVAELTASDGGPDDCFGWAVGLSGKTVLVGAEKTHADSGAAYVFTQRNARKWTQHHELRATDGGTTDQFGYSASLSGTMAIVGADQAEGGAGAAFIYKL
jgi:hypothetical protein